MHVICIFTWIGVPTTDVKLLSGLNECPMKMAGANKIPARIFLLSSGRSDNPMAYDVPPME